MQPEIKRMIDAVTSPDVLKRTGKVSIAPPTIPLRSAKIVLIELALAITVNILNY